MTVAGLKRLRQEDVHDPPTLARTEHELLRVQVDAQVHTHQTDSLRLEDHAEPGRRTQVGEVEIARQREDIAGVEKADPLERAEQR